MDIRFYILSILFIVILCAFEVGQSANIGFEFHLKSYALPREFDRQYTGTFEPMADPHFDLGVGGGGAVLNFLALLAFLSSIHFLFYPK